MASDLICDTCGEDWPCATKQTRPPTRRIGANWRGRGGGYTGWPDHHPVHRDGSPHRPKPPPGAGGASVPVARASRSWPWPEAAESAARYVDAQTRLVEALAKARPDAATLREQIEHALSATYLPDHVAAVDAVMAVLAEHGLVEREGQGDA